MTCSMLRLFLPQSTSWNPTVGLLVTVTREPVAVGATSTVIVSP